MMIMHVCQGGHEFAVNQHATVCRLSNCSAKACCEQFAMSVGPFDIFRKGGNIDGEWSYTIKTIEGYFDTLEDAIAVAETTTAMNEARRKAAARTLYRQLIEAGADHWDARQVAGIY